MPNILVISDVHLGSPVSRVKNLVKVLKNENYKHLIINGDLFDNKHIHRYKKKHWSVLSLIRKISKKKKVTMVIGNHDECSYSLIKILGLDFVNEYSITVNDKRMLFIHYHQFDSFIKKYPIISIIAEKLYYFIQMVDRTKKISTWLKKTSKSFLNVRTSVRDKALDFIANKPYDAIFGGHLHYAEIYKDGTTGKEYYNSGSFCDSICHYILIDDRGHVTLKHI
jgi:UDP-2,3-diacylglucosamine pyrophosphatase LpxH